MGSVRYLFAVLLSLVAPGTGHFLLGAFRRGIAWAVGLSVLGLGIVFALPVSLVSLVVIALVGIAGRVAAAIDTARLTVPRPAWTRVVVALAGYLLAAVAYSVLVDEPTSAYYRTHYAASYTIPSAGMEPTLVVGDYVLADNSVYRRGVPRRGDVVVFRSPMDDRRTLVKRVVALPGERVQIRSGEVYIDGRLLSEPYARPADDVPAAPDACAYAYGCVETLVPAGSYFVLGDNRGGSQDSRHWGFVVREQIRGRAVTIYWSWDGSQHWVRWNRVGRAL